MAITYIQERHGKASRSNGVIRATRVLLYKVDNGSNASDIILDTNIPDDGATHPTISGIFVSNISEASKVSGDEKDGSYTVTVSYTSNTNEYPSADFDKDDDPWEQVPLEVTFDTREIVVPQVKAYTRVGGVITDEQFTPTAPMEHPATGEALISETIETHSIISFKYNLKDFSYEWKRKFENTINLNSIVIMGIHFPVRSLLLRSIGVVQRPYTDSSDRQRSYYEISPVFEDFHKTISKQLALRGFTFLDSADKIKSIQLKDGTFDTYDQFDTTFNISTPRFVSVAGAIAQKGDTIDALNFYKEFPDKFESDWKSLNIPTGKTTRSRPFGGGTGALRGL